MTSAYCVPISVLCLLCCPVPRQVDGTPVLCNSASAASAYVPICFVFMSFCFIFLCSGVIVFGPPSLPSFGSLVSSLAHQLDMEMLFFYLGVTALFFSFLFLSCLPSGLFMSSLCWSIIWTYHRTDRTSKQQPCPSSACALSGC